MCSDPKLDSFIIYLNNSLLCVYLGNCYCVLRKILQYTNLFSNMTITHSMNVYITLKYLFCCILQYQLMEFGFLFKILF